MSSGPRSNDDHLGMKFFTLCSFGGNGEVLDFGRNAVRDGDWDGSHGAEEETTGGEKGRGEGAAEGGGEQGGKVSRESGGWGVERREMTDEGGE